MTAGVVAPVRVSIVNDYEVVVRGLAQMLAPYADVVQVVELDSLVETTSAVDVALFDTFAHDVADGPDLDGLLANPNVGRVVIYTWGSDEDLMREASRRGADGYLPKTLDAEQLVDAIVRIAAGEKMVISDESGRLEGPTMPAWPGQEMGLTAREAEMLGLITQGLTNEEIARRSYLSINSVKTYIRTAYRRIGVARRSQAVAWGITHGMAPRATRTVIATAARPVERTAARTSP